MGEERDIRAQRKTEGEVDRGRSGGGILQDVDNDDHGKGNEETREDDGGEGEAMVEADESEDTVEEGEGETRALHADEEACHVDCEDDGNLNRCEGEDTEGDEEDTNDEEEEEDGMPRPGRQQRDSSSESDDTSSAVARWVYSNVTRQWSSSSESQESQDVLSKSSHLSSMSSSAPGSGSGSGSNQKH